jgi:hypothetical protein
MRAHLLLVLTLPTEFVLAAQQPAAQPPAAVELTPRGASVRAGQAVQFAVTVRDATGAEVRNPQVVWAAAPFDVAGIDQSGKLTAFRQGRAQVFAIVGGRPTVAVVDVRPKPPATVELSAVSPELVVGGSAVLSAVARTEDQEPLRDAPIRFRSSNERVAVVREGGVVIGRAPGEATVTAEASTAERGDPVARGELRVRVVPTPVTRLEVEGTAGARAGDVIRLRARGLGVGGRAVADPPVRWSVSGPGAAV